MAARPGGSVRPDSELPCSAIFKGLNPDARAALSPLATLLRFRAGETVQHESDATRSVGFVDEGVLRLVKYRPDGHQHVIGLLTKGAMFGRLFDRMPPVTVEASTNAVICCFERSAFEALLIRYPELEHQILLTVCDELDTAHDCMIILTSPHKTERIATFMLQLWREARAQDPEHREPTEITLPISRADLASYLGTSAETLSRILSRLAREKVIEMARGRVIRLLDWQRLVALSGWDPDDWAKLSFDADGGRRRLAQVRTPRSISWSPRQKAQRSPRSASS
jgi:CRP/FNR family transcriptional regulator, anaerobic regulatory protein